MIKEILFNDWYLMRWIRLALGIYIAVQAVQLHDILAGFIAAFFLIQAITNTGCCGARSCTVPAKTNRNNTKEIDFKEIKVK
jgi:hypothetical protein